MRDERGVAAAAEPAPPPYRAVMESDPGLPTHTVYRPADLAALGKTKLPILAWANGACANEGDAFAKFLTEIAGIREDLKRALDREFEKRR